MFSINKKVFERCVGFFSENRIAYRCLEFVYKILPNIFFVAYPALLIWVFLRESNVFLEVLLIPLSVLILVSVLRVLINAERPYERYGVPSVFNKQTKRESMPSRHTASAAVIAMMFLRVSLPIGIAALCVAALIAVSRIAAGAHFIRDVIVGALVGVFAGLFAFFI